MFGRKEKITHRHYVYTCLFNNVSVENEMSTCTLEDQREVFNEQYKKSLKFFPEKYQCLLYFGRELCVYAVTTKEWKNSSDATASRDFLACDYAQRELLEGKNDKMYVSEEEVGQVFDEHFVSLKTMSSLCNEVTASLAEVVEKLQEPNHAPTVNDIESIKTLIHKKHEAIIKMKLNYELPYNDWLYDLVREKLTPLGFAVFFKVKCCSKVCAAINEYVFCKSDLLLYHELHETIQALHVSVSQLSLSDQDDSIVTVDVSGAVAELKVESFGIVAENECFYNMFGEAAKLTLQVLCKGKVVKHVKIYGIVVAPHEHRYAQLLKLEINYFEGTCTFERCNKRSPFMVLLNKVISVLDKSSIVS